MSETTKQYNQYFSARPKISITMPLGQRINFVGGVYLTATPAEIAFLDEQIAQGHQMIYTKAGAEKVSADALDPLAAIKKKAIEEYIAQKALNSDPNRDMGSTAVQAASLNITTTKSIAEISAGSKSPK